MVTDNQLFTKPKLGILDFFKWTQLLSFHYDFAFLWGEAVEVEDAGVYLFVSLADLLREGLASLGVVVEVRLPFVLLSKGELYLLLLQLCQEALEVHLVEGL